MIEHTTSKSEFLLIMLPQTTNKIYVTSTFPLNNKYFSPDEDSH